LHITVLPRVRVEAGPAMDEQNSGPPFLDVIPTEQAGQRGIEVTV